VIAFFILALLLSGLTALPLKTEADLLASWFGEGSTIGAGWPAVADWIDRVHEGITEVDARYPFIFYGTDWLVFAHIVIAIAFVGPLRDPVRNVWVIEFGMIACILVIPAALIFGSMRGIPFYWRILDCLFGVFGVIPLAIARSGVRRLAAVGKQA
jgi:hypothetical protein